MSDETRIVQAVPDLPVQDGMERLVADLAEQVTRQVSEAYVAGFKLGITETLRILRDSGRLDAALDTKINALLAHYDQEDTDEHTP